MTGALAVLCPTCNTPPGVRCRTLTTRRSTDASCRMEREQ